jgi:hypothetical protein
VLRVRKRRRKGKRLKFIDELIMAIPVYPITMAGQPADRYEGTKPAGDPSTERM